jgi:hypothetical protein
MTEFRPLHQRSPRFPFLSAAVFTERTAIREKWVFGWGVGRHFPKKPLFVPSLTDSWNSHSETYCTGFLGSHFNRVRQPLET